MDRAFWIVQQCRLTERLEIVAARGARSYAVPRDAPVSGTVPRVPFALGPTTFRIAGDMSPDVNAPVMGPFESSHQHGPAFARPGPGANPFPDVLARMQPSDSLPPVGRGAGRPWPVAYPVPRATRRKKGLPGAWAVLFQRAVGSDPAGCASRRAHRVETAIAVRLHNALGTQNERYFVAVNPTAHSLACLRIGVFVTADAARLAPGVGGSPFTGRVFAPVGRRTKFHDVTASSLPFDQPCLVAPCNNAAIPVPGGPRILTRWCVARGGGAARCARRQRRPCGAADGLVPPAPAAPAAPDTRPAGPRRRAVPARG